MLKKLSKRILSIAVAAATMLVTVIPSMASAGTSAATTDPIYDRDLSANFGGLVMTEPYNTYSDSENGARGAYVASNPAAVGAPFIHVFYDQGIDLTKTTGAVYVNLYWEGTAAAGDMLVVGFTSESREEQFLTSANAQWPLDLTAAIAAGSLKQGWNVLTYPVGTQGGLPIDTTNITGFRIYNANSTGTTALACGAVYAVDKDDPAKKYYMVNALGQGKSDGEGEGQETGGGSEGQETGGGSEGQGTGGGTENPVTYHNEYFIEATADEVLYSSQPGFVNNGFSNAAPYNSYGDNTRGAYKAKLPTAQVNLYDTIVAQIWAGGMDLTDYTGIVTANIYFTGTDTDGPLVFSWFNTDGKQIEYIMSSAGLKQGWNEVQIDLAALEKDKGVSMQKVSLFYIYTTAAMNDVSDLAIGAIYVQKPGESGSVVKKDRKTYLLDAIVSSETDPYACTAFFDASFNGYGDRSRGAYVREGGIDNDFWFAKNLNNVNLSNEKYAIVNFYLDDPDKFTSMFIELSSGGVYDKNERNWVISKYNTTLKKGWNSIVIDLNNPVGSEGGGSIGYAVSDIGGTYDASAVNFMRIYGTYGGSKSAVGSIYLSATTTPETGDNSVTLVMILSMLMLAGSGAAMIILFRKKVWSK